MASLDHAYAQLHRDWGCELSLLTLEILSMRASTNLPKNSYRLWLVTITCILLTAGPTATAHAANWYVKATAMSGGNGTKDMPFDSLADAEAASGAGDTIFILQSHSRVILDGGIALKPDQKLIGLGPDVRIVPDNAAAARITNSTGGDIVQLSTGNEITGIHFKDMSRDAISGIGVDFSGTNIHGNLFSGANPLVFSRSDSIFLVSFAGNTSNVNLRDNVFRDGESLGGIVTIHLGDSSGDYHLEGNRFENLGHRSHAMFSFDTANVEALILDSSSINNGVGGNNADSILLQLAGSSTQDVLVQEYTYDNPDQVGNISNSGLEVFTIGDGNSVSLQIEDSTFRNTVTEAIQVFGFGANTLIDVQIRNSRVIDANPSQIAAATGGFFRGGAITVIPECLPVGSPTCLGLGGTGNLTTLLIENSDITGSSGYAVSVLDSGAGFSSVIDMGGGALGSIGKNRILDNTVGEIELLLTDGVGESNWWGEGSPRVDIIGAGSFDYDPVLVADPRPECCPPP